MAAIAVAAFSMAVARFSDAAEEGCARRAREDPTYQVRFREPPSMERTRYRLAVSRAGRPVAGAEVCLNAYMRGMSAMAVADRGREVARGVYEVSLTFEMGNRWAGWVLVAEPGRSLVAIPLDLDVREAPASDLVP